MEWDADSMFWEALGGESDGVIAEKIFKKNEIRCDRIRKSAKMAFKKSHPDLILSF